MGGVLRGATVVAIGETFWRHEGSDGARTDVYKDASDGGDANGEIDDKDTGVAGGECGTAHVGARGVVDVSGGDQTDHVWGEAVPLVQVCDVDQGEAKRDGE